MTPVFTNHFVQNSQFAQICLSFLAISMLGIDTLFEHFAANQIWSENVATVGHIIHYHCLGSGIKYVRTGNIILHPLLFVIIKCISNRAFRSYELTSLAQTLERILSSDVHYERPLSPPNYIKSRTEKAFTYQHTASLFSVMNCFCSPVIHLLFCSASLLTVALCN